MTRTTLLAGLALTLLVGALHLAVWQSFNAQLDGDELRYVSQAELILQGQSPYPNGVVKNTPLFPVLLATSMQLGVDRSMLNLVSIISVTGATLLLFLLLCRICRARWAFAVAAILAVYPPLVQIGSQVMTEPLAVLLVMSVCWVMRDVREFRHPGVLRWLSVAVLLAALALLKPIFGYTLAAGLCLSLSIAGLAPSVRSYFLGAAGSCLTAIVLCSPFLFYIHALTGSYYSWGTTGGEHLYWMAIGGEDIWGSWVPPDEVRNYPFLVENGFADEVEEANRLDGAASQAYLAERAWERIFSQPSVFITNVVANAGRTLFNYPYSFRPQSLYTYAYIMPNLIVYLCAAVAVLLLPATRRHQSAGLVSLLVFCLIYLGGNILVGSTARQGLVLLGPLLLWLTWQVRLLVQGGVINPSALARMKQDGSSEARTTRRSSPLPGNPPANNRTTLFATAHPAQTRRRAKPTERVSPATLAETIES